MSITIRRAGDEDVGLLAGLRRAWNEESASGPIDDDDLPGRDELQARLGFAPKDQVE